MQTEEMIEAAKNGKIPEIVALLARRAEVDCKDSVSPCNWGVVGRWAWAKDTAIAKALDQRESLGVSTGIRGRSPGPHPRGRGGGHPLRLGLGGGAKVHPWAEAALARRRQAP